MRTSVFGMARGKFLREAIPSAASVHRLAVLGSVSVWDCVRICVPSQ